jgi:hypothetical protein
MSAWERNKPENQTYLSHYPKVRSRSDLQDQAQPTHPQYPSNQHSTSTASSAYTLLQQVQAVHRPQTPPRALGWPLLRRASRVRLGRMQLSVSVEVYPVACDRGVLTILPLEGDPGSHKRRL